MKILECTVNKNFEEDTLTAISFVKEPAIESTLIALSKKGMKVHKLESPVAGPKKIIYSPALIPNKLILRKDEETGEYYQIYFTEETVAKASEIYMKSNINSFTYDHESKVQDCNIIENWIVQNPDNDKSKELGYNLPKGTWFTGIKVSDEIWDKVKNGDVKGLSIEGMFLEKLAKLGTQTEIDAEAFLKMQLTEIYNTAVDDEAAEKMLAELYKSISA